MIHAKQKNMDTSKHASVGSQSHEYRCLQTGELLLKIERVRMDLIIEPPRGDCPWVVITEELFQEAKRLIPQIQLQNDRANEFDALTGTVGELAFAQWFYGDFRSHSVGRNFGKSDFEGIEVKTSLHTLTSARHLIAKASYVETRPAAFYVQCFCNSSTPRRGPLIGDTVFVAGWLAKEQLLNLGRENWEVTRDGENTGIRTLRVPLPRLNPMEEFKEAYQDYLNKEAL